MVSVQEPMAPIGPPKPHTPTIVRCVAWLAIGMGVWHGWFIAEMLVGVAFKMIPDEFYFALFFIPFLAIMGLPSVFCLYFGWKTLRNPIPANVRGTLASMLVLVGFFLASALVSRIYPDSESSTAFAMACLTTTILLIPVYFYAFRVISVVAHFREVAWRDFVSKKILLFVTIELSMTIAIVLVEYDLLRVQPGRKLSEVLSVFFTFGGLMFLQFAIPNVFFLGSVAVLKRSRRRHSHPAQLR